MIAHRWRSHGNVAPQFRYVIAACRDDRGARGPVEIVPMENSAPRKGRRGRPSKGNRVGTFVALPVELRQACLEVASQEGLPLGDVVTRLVAESLGREAPAYCYPQRHEELPLTKAS